MTHHQIFTTDNFVEEILLQISSLGYYVYYHDSNIPRKLNDNIIEKDGLTLYFCNFIIATGKNTLQEITKTVILMNGSGDEIAHLNI